MTPSPEKSVVRWSLAYDGPANDRYARHVEDANGGWVAWPHVEAILSEQHRLEAENRSLREASAGARELWKLLHWEREQVKPPDYYSPFEKQGWRQAMAQGRTILSDYEQHGIGADAFALREAGAPAATSPSEEENILLGGTVPGNAGVGAPRRED